VTPPLGPKPVFLAGFGENRRATKVHDPIMARAVVLADGPDRIALVSVDVVGLFLPVVEAVRAKQPGFKYILVSSTHNHEGPDTMGLWGPNPFRTGVDDEYLKRVTDGVSEAIRKAAEGLTPATAEVGTARGPHLLHDGRKPLVLHDELSVLRFRNADGKSVGMMVNWHCHPETLDSRNTELSADFVAATVAELKRVHGCPVAYFTGTVGGLMTSLHVPIKDDAGVELKDGTFEKTERYGKEVAGLATAALKTPTPVRLTPFSVRTKTVLLPIQNPLYRLAWQVGKLKRPLYKWTGDATPTTPIASTDPINDPAARTEIGYLTLGEVDVAAIPGEIYPELVLNKVQNPPDVGADYPTAPVEPSVYPAMSGKHKWLIGLANDEIGYIIPKRQWDEQKPFCYGLKKAQYGEINSVGPEAAPILCGVFQGLTKK
jgi:hypothetical protein